MREGRGFAVASAIAFVAMMACNDSRSASAPPAQQGPWTIVASAGAGGTITPSGNVTVPHGASQSFAVAASAGFTVSDVTVDGVSQGPIRSYTFSNVTAAHAIGATFVAASPTSWVITATASAGGTITPSGDVSVQDGASQSFDVAASAGFTVSDVTVDGVSQGPISTYTFSNVTAAHTIGATFVAAPVSWIITATAGAGGTITPAGAVTVPDGESQSFTVAPSAGFILSDVTVDGVSQGAITGFTFTNVTAAHTIGASFTAQPTSAVVRLRTDGTLPAGTRIGGVQATLTYATDKGLSIAAADVLASGAGAGSLLVANANTAGQVIVALINANGIAAGEFATATFAVAPPNVPADADFALSAGATVIDLNGAAIPGMAVVIGPPDIL